MVKTQSKSNLTSLKKRRVLNTWITNAPFETMVDEVIRLGRARESSYVCVTSVHMVMEAQWDKDFQALHKNAVMATPDGKPVSLCMNWVYGTDQVQVAGENLMIRTFQRAEEEGLSIFFLGTTDDVLEELKKRLTLQYPNLKIAGMISPPFRPLSESEENTIVDEINASGTHILMVALGCPKQENWMAKHQGKVQAVMLGVGAAFPFFTGHVQRAPVWMRKICLEWFYRVVKEPRRLFIRYLITNIPFMGLIGLQWLKHKLGLDRETSQN